MRTRCKRAAREEHANQLETALRFGPIGRPETDELLDLAKALESNITTSEDTRATIKERMMRAAAAEWAEPGRSDAGSLDSQTQSAEVHIAEVDLPDGRARLADVEAINEARAAEIARLVAELDQVQSDER